VTLLGDAAHPTLQYMAQGACMAMEDAVSLSRMMAAFPADIEKALEAYQSRRLLRTARVQLQSRAIGEHIYHPAGIHAELRNTIMRGKTSADWYDSLSWLYGWNALSEG
jgi:salicylate hydroxylase